MEARHTLPDWPSHRDALQARWPALTPGDLLAIDGELEYLVEALQMRYELDRAEAQAQSDAFVAELRASTAANDGNAAATVRETLAPGVAKLREGLAEIGTGLRILAGDTVDRGRGAVGRGRDAVREVRGEIGETAREGAHRVAERTDEVLQRTERYIRERPFTALGIAFVAGWLLLGRK